MAGSQFTLFQDAKKVIRRAPELTDVQVAEALGIPDRIIALSGQPGDAMCLIATARRDVEAAKTLERSP
jgi:hypothetical protein